MALAESTQKIYRKIMSPFYVVHVSLIGDSELAADGGVSIHDQIESPNIKTCKLGRYVCLPCNLNFLSGSVSRFECCKVLGSDETWLRIGRSFSARGCAMLVIRDKPSIK